jgi:hypothetical protein
LDTSRSKTTERYLGRTQKLRCALNDRMGIEPDWPLNGGRMGRIGRHFATLRRPMSSSPLEHPDIFLVAINTTDLFRPSKTALWG